MKDNRAVLEIKMPAKIFDAAALRRGKDLFAAENVFAASGGHLQTRRSNGSSQGLI
jgi:hypothetical protein